MTFTSTATATAATASITTQDKPTTITTPAITTTTTTTTKTMEQDLFQFFDSLSQPSPVGEWYQDLSSTSMAPTSVHTSPEIATPLDIQLSPSVIKMEQPLNSPGSACAFGSSTTTTSTPTRTAASMGMAGVADLDMSEILNSPLFDSPLTTMATPMMTPGTPHADMFSDMCGQQQHQDLPAALAAFVAAVSTTHASGAPFALPPTPPLPAQGLESTPTPTTTDAATTTASRKRSSASVEPTADELPLDEAALKRRKNTDAARRSRLKKVMKMEAFEKRVNELERLNAQLLLRVAVLDSEKSHLQSKEAAHDARVLTLEAQLAEAHKALASRSM